MKSTAFFRDECCRIESLLALFPARGSQFDARRALGTLAQLNARLEQHMSAEAARLTPHLLKHRDAAVRVRAVRFAAQTAAFMRFFRAFVMRWPTSAALDEAPAAFIADCENLGDALRAHFRDEEEALYDLVDCLAATCPEWARLLET